VFQVVEEEAEAEPEQPRGGGELDHEEGSDPPVVEEVEESGEEEYDYLVLEAA